jgi:uncharacterized protein YfaS (alpha-2-macroglobulin family)
MQFYYNNMVDNLNKRSWISTQEMGWAFIAAYKHFGNDLNVAKKVNYAIEGLPKPVTTTHSSFESKIHSIGKASWGKAITIENRGSGDLYVTQNDRFVSDKIETPAEQSVIKITSTITKTGGSLANIAKLGDDIFINVTVKNTTSAQINDLALNTKMASGWELINPRIYGTGQDQGINFTYQDYRDDRVYTFFNLNPGESQTFSFRAKVAYIGDFFLPAITCEHMYDGSIVAKTASSRVVVKYENTGKA